MTGDPIRVLLVDDEISFRGPMGERLAKRGIQVDEAASGPEALAIARACGGDYDVAIIDQVMGPPNGIETMRQLRQLYPDIEVIILTGWGDMEPGEEAIKAGAYRYLSKPIRDSEELALNVRMAALYGQERQRRLALQALVRAGQRIGAVQTQDELYRHLYKETEALLPNLDSFVVTCYDEQNKILSFPFWCVRGRELQVSSRRDGNGIAEYVLRQKAPLLLGYGDEAFRQAHHLAPPDAILGYCTSEIVVPIFVEGRSWGTIHAMSTQSGVHFTGEHLEVLQAFANQAAVAIRNVQQLVEARQLQDAIAALAWQRGQEAVSRAIVISAHQLIGHDYTSLILQDPDGTLHKAPAVMPEDYEDPFEEPRQSDGITRLVIRERRHKIIPDAQQDPLVKDSMRRAGIRSILAMPLIYGERVPGVLFTHTFEPWHFGSHELSLLYTFASYAASVLHSALEERASEIWKTLDREIATCSNRKAVYRLFAEHAREALHADFAVYYPYDPTVSAGKSQLVLGDCVSIGQLNTPWQIPQGGLGGGVSQSMAQISDGLLIVNDVESQEGRWRSHLTEREGVKAFLGLRLDVVPEGQSEPQTVGRLYLNFRRCTHFEPIDLVALRFAGSRVAAAIQRLILLDVLQEQRRQLNERLRAVVEIFDAFRERRDKKGILTRIAEVAKEVLSLDNCVLVEYDPERGCFTDQVAAASQEPEAYDRLSQAFQSWSLDKSEPVVIWDVQKDERVCGIGLPGVQSLVIYPLRVEGEPLGLFVALYGCAQAILPESLETVGLLGDLAGLVIHEIRLVEALGHTQKRLKRREFLDWVAMLENTWRHSLVGKAAAIQNHVGILEKRLERSTNLAEAMEGVPTSVREIGRLAREIASAPPRVPQSWEMEEELLPLASLLEEVAQREGQPLESRAFLPIETKVEVQGLGGVQVSGYRRWLIYAIEALLQNAGNALPQGGTITITGQRRETWAEVRISDTGKGVPPAVRPKLFRELIPRAEDRTGMGIGSLLAATIVENHGGSIELEKPGPGDTTVLIRLPVAKETE